MVLFTSTLSSLIFCLLLLLITDRGAEASNCKGGFVYFSLRFCLFTSCVLLLYCRVYTHCCCSVPKLCLTLSTPRSAAGQASLSSTISQSLLKLMSIESVIPSRPLSPPSRPALSPSIRFSSESALCISKPKYWSFSFSISSSNEYSGLIFFRIDWLDLAV